MIFLFAIYVDLYSVFHCFLSMCLHTYTVLYIFLWPVFVSLDLLQNIFSASKLQCFCRFSSKYVVRVWHAKIVYSAKCRFLFGTPSVTVKSEPAKQK